MEEILAQQEDEEKQGESRSKYTQNQPPYSTADGKDDQDSKRSGHNAQGDKIPFPGEISAPKSPDRHLAPLWKHVSNAPVDLDPDIEQ